MAKGSYLDHIHDFGFYLISCGKLLIQLTHSNDPRLEEIDWGQDDSNFEEGKNECGEVLGGYCSNPDDR